MAGFHHVEVWVADLDRVRTEWAWLLTHIGFTLDGEWPDGQSWAAGGAYLTLTTSPTMTGLIPDRRRPGVNPLAFKGGDTNTLDAIMARAVEHGWRPLYQDRYPHAGGPDHYAGWLEDSAGFKVEVVADQS